VETQSSVRIKELRHYVEAEPLALGVEEVSGNLSCFQVSSVASSYIAPVPLVSSALLREWPRILPSTSRSTAGATGRWRSCVGRVVGLTKVHYLCSSCGGRYSSCN